MYTQEIKKILLNLTNEIYKRIYKTDKKNTLNTVLEEIPELRNALEAMDIS